MLVYLIKFIHQFLMWNDLQNLKLVNLAINNEITPKMYVNQRFGPIINDQLLQIIMNQTNNGSFLKQYKYCTELGIDKINDSDTNYYNLTLLLFKFKTIKKLIINVKSLKLIDEKLIKNLNYLTVINKEYYINEHIALLNKHGSINFVEKGLKNLIITINDLELINKFKYIENLEIQIFPTQLQRILPEKYYLNKFNIKNDLITKNYWPFWDYFQQFKGKSIKFSILLISHQDNVDANLNYLYLFRCFFKCVVKFDFKYLFEIDNFLM